MKTLKTKPLDLGQLKVFGRRIAHWVQPEDVLALSGDVGAGKTTFARALIQEMLGKEAVVPSPTYTLVQTYDTPRGSVFHYDFYRLKHVDEVWALGLEESFFGIVLIEWPERGGGYPPAKTIEICFEGVEEHRRLRLVTQQTFSVGRWHQLKRLM